MSHKESITDLSIVKRYIDIGTDRKYVFLYDDQFITLLYDIEKSTTNAQIMEVISQLDIFTDKVEMVEICEFLNEKEKEYYKLKYG